MNTFYIRDARSEPAALRTLYAAFVKSLPKSKQALVAHSIPPKLMATPGLICFQDKAPAAALLWRTTEDGIAVSEFYAESPRATKESVQALLRGFFAGTNTARSRYFELWTPEGAKAPQILREEKFQQLERQLVCMANPITSPALWNQFRFLSLRNFGASPAGCTTISRLLREAYAGTVDGAFYEEYQRPEACQAYVSRVVNSPLCDLRNSWLAWSPSANKLAGVALSYIWPGASALYLEQLVVHPTFRGKGLGRALLSSVCGPLSDGSVHKVVMTVSNENLPANALIKSSGAQPIHSEFAFKQTPGTLERETPGERSERTPSQKESQKQPEPVLR